MPCQSQTVIPFLSGAVLKLEMIQVQKVNWYMKQSSFQRSPIQDCLVGRIGHASLLGNQ